MKAWWFDNYGGRLGHNDGREVKIGETHEIVGSIVACGNGLHGSIRILDALSYANSTVLYRVNITGDIDKQSDKIAGRKRKYLYGGDVEHILRRFACDCALENIEKIKPYCSEHDYDLIIDYLHDPTEDKREAVWAAAYDADMSADMSAAYDAAIAARAARAASSARNESSAYAAASAAYAAASAAKAAAIKRYNDKLESMIKEHFGDNR